MIESSAHGDEYDGVIFSQLVRLKYPYIVISSHADDRTLLLISPFLSSLSLELDRFSWI